MQFKAAMEVKDLAQVHIANQLKNVYDFNEGPRLHERVDAFDLPERQ